MEHSAYSTEQRQLLVEIEAVTTNIGKAGEPQKSSYEVEQGRKLIEKAASLGLPLQSYAALKDHVAALGGNPDD